MTALAQDFDWGEWTDIVEALESSARKRLEKVKSLINQGYLVHAFSKAANNDKKSIGCDNPRVNDKSLRVNDLSLADLVGFVHQNQNDEQVLDEQLTLLRVYQNNTERYAHLDKKLTTDFIMVCGAGSMLLTGALASLVGHFDLPFGTTLHALTIAEGLAMFNFLLSKDSTLKTLIDGGQMKIFEDTVIRAITAEMMEKKCTEHLRSLAAQPV